MCVYFSGIDHLASLPTGGKFAFVWDIVQRTCCSVTRPLVLFIKDAEHTICDSFEREAAFQEAFGVKASLADTAGEAQYTAAVLVAGCSLGDTGADIAPQTLYGSDLGYYLLCHLSSMNFACSAPFMCMHHTWQ